jgi:4a-hydroxytetrahydrobiopterin dehydratase
MMTPLKDAHCKPEASLLSKDESDSLLAQIPGWQGTENNAAIGKLFKFANFHQTIAFVNAVAWIAHQQDHHPDMLVSYNSCTITFTTHSVGGLTENDFICAARINALPH